MQPRHARPSHFFTVDVEEYFQVRALESVVSRTDWLSRPSTVERNVDVLLGALGRRQMQGTFFVLGWIAEHRPGVVRAIVDAGHEVASHGYWHEPVTCLDRKAFREDVRSSKRRLEDVAGTEVIGYRAPNFSIVPGGEWAFDILLEEGYKYDSSLFPIRRSGYGYPGSPRMPHHIRRAAGSLAEFPLATTTIFRYPIPAAGGGYLRQFPLGVIQRAFRQADSRREPATFYIHPWEIDPAQPRLGVSVLNRIRHYRGLATALEKLEQLLDEFRFTTIASYLANDEALAMEAHRAGAA